MKLKWKRDDLGTWANLGGYTVSIETGPLPRWNLFYGDLMITYGRHGTQTTAKKYAREALLKAVTDRPTATRPNLVAMPRPATHN